MAAEGLAKSLLQTTFRFNSLNGNDLDRIVSLLMNATIGSDLLPAFKVDEGFSRKDVCEFFQKNQVNSNLIHHTMYIFPTLLCSNVQGGGVEVKDHGGLWLKDSFF